MNLPTHRLFDVHCHLQDRRILPAFKEVMKASLAAGVERLGCNGCCEDDWPEVRQLAEENKAIVPNFGLHPWWARDRTSDWLMKLREQLQEVPSAGLGECGLDSGTKCPDTSMEVQMEVFAAQIKLGKELGRPISVHCVKAFTELQAMLQQQEGGFPAGLILHSWQGSAQMVPALAAIPGVHFSVSGFTLRSEKAPAMLKQIPLDRILLETDSPDGLPQQRPQEHPPISDAGTQQDTRLNHPANIRVVLEVVAEMRGEDAAIVADAAFENANRLFPLSS